MMNLLAANLAALAMTFSAPTVQGPTHPCDWNPPAPIVPPDCHSIEVNIALGEFRAAIDAAQLACRVCMNQATVDYKLCILFQSGLHPWDLSLNCWYIDRMARMLCSLNAGGAVVEALITVQAAIEAACP